MIKFKNPFEETGNELSNLITKLEATGDPQLIQKAQALKPIRDSYLGSTQANDEQKNKVQKALDALKLFLGGCFTTK
jgi:hypothetical protein